MKATKMPAPNEYAWYKWFPAKCLTSLRWTTLTLEQEGCYRRLYDLAALAQPSSRRGWFYEHDRPSPLREVFHSLRIHHSKGYAIVKQLASKGLMAQDENAAWGFPNFGKHQHHAPLRPRPDGLGSAEIGQQLGANRATDTDTDADADVEKKESPQISLNDDLAKRLAATYVQHTKKRGLEGKAIETFREALDVGIKAEDVEAGIFALRTPQEKLAPPWAIINAMRPTTGIGDKVLKATPQTETVDPDLIADQAQKAAHFIARGGKLQAWFQGKGLRSVEEQAIRKRLEFRKLEAAANSERERQTKQALEDYRSGKRKIPAGRIGDEIRKTLGSVALAGAAKAEDDGMTRSPSSQVAASPEPIVEDPDKDSYTPF